MKKIALSFILLGALFVTSCDKGFEEMNTNPNAPVVVPAHLLINDVVFNATNSMYSTFVGGDMGECWAQHWSKVQYNDEERYSPRNNVLEINIWKTLYEDVVAGGKSIEKLAIAEENSAVQGVGLVLQAYGYSVLTDMFGDIPFSEAMRADEGIFAPKYDSQQDVYTGILAMLDQANTLFAADNGSIPSTSDILYSGDVNKWHKFANSLKFRCLMRISGEINVAAQLQELMSRPMFTSSGDEAKLAYLSADPNANPIFESIVFGNRNEFKVNSVLVDMLTDLNDPRLEVYAQPNKDGEYRGKPSGYANVPNNDYDYNNVSPIGTLYLEATAPGYWMSFSELSFLMAEAAQKGYITGDAKTYYEQGITASFEANGLSAADATTYYNQGTVAYSSASGLQQIAEQNWLGLFCQGVEAWTEWRRTGFPVLSPAFEAFIPTIPARYTYPGIEQSVNAAGYNAAIANQGPNLLTTKVWWMN